MFGPPDSYGPGPLPHRAAPEPATLYGAYKLADEWMARVYQRDYGVSSIGLRPACLAGGVVQRRQGDTGGPALPLPGLPGRVRIGRAPGAVVAALGLKLRDRAVAGGAGLRADIAAGRFEGAGEGQRRADKPACGRVQGDHLFTRQPRRSRTRRCPYRG